MFRRNVSSGLTESGVFEDWEVEETARVIESFRRTNKQLTEEDCEDLLSECLVQWLGVREAPARNPRARLRTLVRNKVRDFLRSRRAEKRGGKRGTDSLDRPVGDDDSELTLGDTIAGDRESEESVGLRNDFWRVMDKLTGRERQVAGMLLEGYPVAEICEVLTLSKSTVHDDKRRIRQLFSDEGLRDHID